MKTTCSIYKKQTFYFLYYNQTYCYKNPFSTFYYQNISFFELALFLYWLFQQILEGSRKYKTERNLLKNEEENSVLFLNSNRLQRR